MKRIRKCLAGLLCVVCMLTVFPSGAYAANNVEPAGFIDQINSVLMMPEPGGALPTEAVNYVPNTIVTAEWTPSGTVKVDTPYNFKLIQVLGDERNTPFYVYAREGTIYIALQFPSGRTKTLVSQTFAENPGIAWQIDYNYVSHVGLWTWGTINYNSTVSFTPYHSINYNANGGRIIGSGYPTYAEDGGSVPVYSLPQAEKTGYVFGGWEIDSGGGLSLGGTLEQSLSEVYGPIYLKAIWNKAPENYTLRFHANGGSGSMSSITVTEGQSTRLPNNTFTRDGYAFTGWNTKTDGSGTNYGDGAYATFYGNSTLYAQWQKYADPVITFDKNDGSSTTVTQTVPYGSSATLNPNSFTRTGYTFTGWNTKVDGGGTSYNDGASISPSANVTLYAQWQCNAYTLSFDANGGSGSMNGKTANHGESIRLPANGFTREKYNFAGWNTKADGSGTAYDDRASLTLTADTTLYAQWTLVTDYTVLLPDGDNITVDPGTRIGSAQIGIQSGSVIPENKQLQMSVNAGAHYDDNAQCYRLLNSTGGQLLFYVLAYKGTEVNPGNAKGGALLEIADSDAVFAGFQNRVSVTVGTARAAGSYTDTLTFRFALV